MSAATMRIGNVEVMALIDVEGLRVKPSAIFPDIAEEAWRQFADHMTPEGELPLAMTSFLLRSDGKTILVDTGIGNKHRRGYPDGHLPDSLAEAGVRPEDIDIVVATHIHVDHVGWHTTADGDGFVPTFHKATHVFVREEWEYFTQPDVANARRNEHVLDCVLPLEGKAEIELVDGERRLTDAITLLPTPGHTPAHSSIAILSGGEAAVIIGDVAHHPAEMIETSWCPVFDMNPALAVQSREALMQRIERERMLVIGGHLAYPGFGRLLRVDGKRTWEATYRTLGAEARA